MALLIGLGVVALLLGWFGISSFKPEASPPAVREQPAAKPAIAEAKPVEAEVRQPVDAPPSPVHQVIPDVPQSALDTIWGTVRVAVRVTLDNQGAVVEAVAEDRGPSRYFERLSLAASKQWTFTPATSEHPRAVLLKFHFTRDGATAHANPVQ